MPRYIDVNKLEEEVILSKENNPHLNSIRRQMHTHEHRHFLCMLNKAPTADVVEVVRCKDCIYNFKSDVDGYFVCSAMTNPNYVPLNHFCGHGERKETTNEI